MLRKPVGLWAVVLCGLMLTAVAETAQAASHAELVGLTVASENPQVGEGNRLQARVHFDGPGDHTCRVNMFVLTFNGEYWQVVAAITRVFSVDDSGDATIWWDFRAPSPGQYKVSATLFDLSAGGVQCGDESHRFAAQP